MTRLLSATPAQRGAASGIITSRLDSYRFSMGLAWLVAGCSTNPEAAASLAITAPKGDAGSQAVRQQLPSSSSSAGPSSPKASSQPAPVSKPEPKSEPRVYAKSRFVWIREYPTSELQWIGFLWTGGSVPLKSEKIHYGPGCEHWYAIEPHGYVCVDGTRATLDATDPVVKALRPHAPNLASAWPHHYGESLGLKRHTQLTSFDPPRLDQREHPDFPSDTLARSQLSTPTNASELAQVARAERPLILTEDPFASLKLAGPVHEGRTRLLPRSTVAYSAELALGDRAFLLAADMTWVPKARVEPYEKVTFEGVELGKTINLPLAFFRGKDRPKYRRAKDGSFELTGEMFARLSYVQLSGTSVKVEQDDASETFLETKPGGFFVKQSDAVLPEPRAKTPWGTEVGGEDTTGHPPGRATWMEASVWQGWLIAYEGTKPVYVTLISSGRGGTPVPDKDPLETASTPTGTFPISGKFATATMEAPGEFIHSDVPWTQNFSGPHALHGAYWHNDWGKLKSAGCVNVSPRDGRWLYGFTEPEVPAGWHGVRWLPSKGPATLFVIHR